VPFGGRILVDEAVPAAPDGLSTNEVVGVRLPLAAAPRRGFEWLPTEASASIQTGPADGARRT